MQENQLSGVEVIDGSFVPENRQTVEPESIISLLRAGSIGQQHPPTLTIEVYEQIGDIGSLNEAKTLHARQGLKLANALLASLPGGTMDALLAELMRRKASLLSVPLED